MKNTYKATASLTGRIAAAFAAVVFALALGAMALPAQQAFAADDKTITITNATEGQTYTLYKLFDATVNADRAGQTDPGSGLDEEVMTDGINYTLPAGKSLQETVGGSLGTTWFTTDAAGNIHAVENADITTAAFADWAKAFGTQIGTPVTADDSGQVVFSGLADGYYYITSSLGSLVTVTSVAPNALVSDKNQSPELDKTEDVKTSYNGDTVTYTVQISLPKGSNNVVFHDKLGDGLALQGTAPTSVTLNAADGTPLEEGDYSVDYWGAAKSDAGDNITISFGEDYLGGLEGTARVFIVYTAKFENQHVNAPNEAYVTYGEHDTDSTHKTIYESSFFFTVNKFDSDGTTALNGAKFALSKSGTLGNLTEDNLAQHAGDLLKFTSTGLYDTAGDTTLFSADNTVNFSGLNNDEGNNPVTYYLYEVTAPNGYNKLTGPVEVVIEPQFAADDNISHGTHVESFQVKYKMPGAADYAIAVDNNGAAASGTDVAHNINITNNKGPVLPSTGDIGTTVFYVIGGILVVAAAVMLIARRKSQR